MKRDLDPGGLLPLSRIEAWFESNGWTTFPFQREVWQAYLEGESGLIHSATGSGKTLAAWLGPLAQWMAEGDERSAPPLRVLWITPMRALASDTVFSMQRAVDGLQLPWTIGLRTGDTSSAERARQAKKLPSALVTTPESLALMLSNANARERLSQLKLVVVDEWHELLGNKRGVMTELCLARLRTWNPKVQTWGLSATLGNVDEALARLTGSRTIAAGAASGMTGNAASGMTGNAASGMTGGRIVRGVSDKKIVMDTLIPDDLDQFPWAGHIGLAMLGPVVEAIDGA
ncbi:MAG TPA: DEAD/DEAH box helicase, partial [Usitatibacter sp.]